MTPDPIHAAAREVVEARNALLRLALAVPPQVHAIVRAKVEAAFAALQVIAHSALAGESDKEAEDAVERAFADAAPKPSARYRCVEVTPSPAESERKPLAQRLDALYEAGGKVWERVEAYGAGGNAWERVEAAAPESGSYLPTGTGFWTREDEKWRVAVNGEFVVGWTRDTPFWVRHVNNLPVDGWCRESSDATSLDSPALRQRIKDEVDTALASRAIDEADELAALREQNARLKAELAAAERERDRLKEQAAVSAVESKLQNLRSELNKILGAK